MKKIAITVLALSLAGCAGTQRPQLMVLPPKPPVVKAAPVPSVEAPVAAPTFKSRFKKFTGKLRWTH